MWPCHFLVCLEKIPCWIERLKICTGGICKVPKHLLTILYPSYPGLLLVFKLKNISLSSLIENAFQDEKYVFYVLNWKEIVIRLRKLIYNGSEATFIFSYYRISFQLFWQRLTLKAANASSVTNFCIYAKFHFRFDNLTDGIRKSTGKSSDTSVLKIMI